MAYKQTRKDAEYLESIIDVDDQVEIAAKVIELMENPTKIKAEEMYYNLIELWFTERRAYYERESIEFTRRVKSIADRHCIDIDWYEN